MNIDQILKFKFKGSRDYVHGTDIVNAIINETSKTKFKLDIKFKELSDTYLNVSKSAENHCTDFSIDEERYYLSPTSSEITENYEYDEDSIVENAIVSTTEISLKDSSKFSEIEVWIALVKKFHLETISQDGKWLFTRAKIDIDKLSAKTENKIVKLKRRIGFKFTESEIYGDNKLIGKIFFSMIEGK